MEKITYLASQYLAAAAISFLEPKSDDSHTNLGFSIDEKSLSTRNLNDKGDTLSFSYDSFNLKWKTSSGNYEYDLDGKSHRDILLWLQNTVEKLNYTKEYNYNFHYDLPYEISEDFVFSLHDAKRLKELLDLRIQAQLVFEELLRKVSLESEIRIWPHHFDTGIYGALEDKEKLAFGMGLAIPDSVSSDHYYYISGYFEGKTMDTSNLKTKNGRWDSENFKGGFLPATNSSKEMIIEFFLEAVSAYKKELN